MVNTLVLWMIISVISTGVELIILLISLCFYSLVIDSVLCEQGHSKPVKGSFLLATMQKQIEGFSTFSKKTMCYNKQGINNSGKVQTQL